MRQWRNQVTDDAQALHTFFFFFWLGGVGVGGGGGERALVMLPY